MAVGTGNFAELIWPGIASLFGHTYQDFPTLYTSFMNVKRATKRFEKVQGVTRLPVASVKPEGASVDYADPQQGFQKEYLMVTYGLGTVITREMYEDEMYNYIQGVPGMLSRSIREAEEITSHNHLNRGFNTAYTGADASPLFSTTHARPTGGTYSNHITTNADLTQTSIETLLQEISQAQDDQGLQIRLRPRALIVHSSNNFRARKILESSYVTGSADNDINPIPGIFDDLVVSPYLTDTDAWFITTDAPEGLTFFRRRDTEIERDNEFDTQNLKVMVTTRFDNGWSDPRGAFGSPGV